MAAQLRLSRTSYVCAALAAVLLAVAAVPEANAATVGRASDGFFGWKILYTANPGETNTVTINHSGSTLTITDSTATMTAGTTCSGGGASVTCPSTSISFVEVQADDGNDSITNNSSSMGLVTTPGMGNDTVTGGGGGDNIHSNSTTDGADTFIGNGGSDQVLYMSRTANLSLTQDGVANDGANCPGGSCEGDNIGADVETIWGGAGNDTVSGNGIANTLYGCDGEDVVEGGGGNDTLRQGFSIPIPGCGTDTWSDTFRGGTGADTIDTTGTGGNDTVTYSERSAAVRVVNDGSGESGQSCPGAQCEGDTIPAYVKGLVGGSGNDTLVGSAAAETLNGNAGSDSISAGAGDDLIYGGDGSDFLNGGNGIDAFFGEGGDDTLYSRDSFGDALSCGPDNGTADADSLDTIEPNCGIVYRDGQLVVSPASGGTTGGGGSGGQGGSDNATPGSGDSGSCANAITATGIKLSGKKGATVQVKSRSRKSCKGTMTLKTAKKFKTSGSKPRQVVLGSVDYSVPAEATSAVKVKLSNQARKLVKKNSKIRVTVTLTLSARASSRSRYSETN